MPVRDAMPPRGSPELGRSPRGPVEGATGVSNILACANGSVAGEEGVGAGCFTEMLVLLFITEDFP
jgi:hypothetical protein